MSEDQDMQQLVAFLTARLDEDEAVAKAAGAPASDLYPSEPIEFVISGNDLSTPQTEAAEEHIRCHNPDRVLRAVEAKRRTLADYAENPLGFVEWPLFPLLNMAAEYAGHPDFQAWWAPDA